MIDIAELRRLEAEATPGKWSYKSKYVFAGKNCIALTDTDNAPDRRMEANAALIVAMRNALPELLKSLKWQPIETAPKDQHILLFGKIDPLNPFEKIRWDKPSVFSGYWDPVDEIWTAHGSTWEGPFMTATHWMPLPLPPHGGGDVG